MFKTIDLFNLEGISSELHTLLQPTWPWQILKCLDQFLESLEDKRLGYVHPTAVLEGPIYLAETASIGPHAYVKGPAWIGENVEVGHGAYVRGYVVLDRGAKLLHSSEAKRSLFLPEAKAPHFNYVGDSILGRKVNLGAGAKLANFKTFGTQINVAGEETGLRKFGSAIGDHTSVGCNAVLSPGTLIGPESIIYNGAMVRGVVPARTVVKLKQAIEHSPRQFK